MFMKNKQGTNKKWSMIIAVMVIVTFLVTSTGIMFFSVVKNIQANTFKIKLANVSSTEKATIQGVNVNSANTAIVINSKTYIRSTDTVELYVEGTDENYYRNSLTTNNITVKVGGVVVTPTTKTLSTPTTIAKGVQYVLTLSGIPGDGELEIGIDSDTLEDKAGNKNIYTNNRDTNVIVDNSAPTKPTITNPSNGGWTNGNVTLTLSTIEAGSGVEKVEKSSDNKTWNTLNAQLTVSGNTVTFSDTWSSEKNGTAYYRVTDKVGNVSEVASTSIKIDKTKPTVSINKTDFDTFSWTASDTSGISGYAITNTEDEPTQWTTDGTLTSGSKDVTAAGTYYVWVKDGAGNTEKTSITAYTMTRSQGTGTTLTTRLDGTSLTTGTAVTSDKVVLSGTTVYAKADVSTGYENAVLKKDGTTITNGSVVNVTSNVTIASSASEISYSISYNLDGGAVQTANKTSYTITTETFGLNEPTKAGYVFAGWTGTGLSAATKNVIITKGSTGNRSYTATWTANPYKIEYYQGNNSTTAGATKLGDSNHIYDVENTLTAYSGTAPTGYTFAGWGEEDSTSAISVKYIDQATVKNLTSTPNGVVKLYAIFKRNLTVKSGAAGVTTATKVQYYNPYVTTQVSSIDVPAPTAITNWTGIGYRDDSTAGNKEMGSGAAGSIQPAYNSGTTIYAAYKRTVKLYSGVNKATSVDLTQYYNSANNVSSIKAPAPASITNWTALGYMDNTTAAEAKYAVTGTESNITPAYTTGNNLYAVYSRDLVISYNGNGSDGGSTANTTKVVYMNTNSTTTSSQTVTLATNGFTKTGYSSSGKWAAGSATGTEYDEGSIYTTTLAYNAATFGTTMYAKWTVNQYAYDLNYKVDDTWYNNGYPGSGTQHVYTAIKIGSEDKGYVHDLSGECDYGTSWEIYGFRFNGVDITYSKKGTMGTTNPLNINLNTITLGVSNENYGSVDKEKLIVIPDTTYTTNGNKLTLSDGREVTASTKAVTGYTVNFVNWSSASGTISQATTVTANFNTTANPYKITLDNQGATTAGTAEFHYRFDTATYYTSSALTTPLTDGNKISIPSKTGYNFAGYYTEQNGGGTQYVKADGTIINDLYKTAGNKTLYAKWGENEYEVTYNYAENGGTSATKTTATVKFGNAIDLTPTATKSGWTFVGWNTNKDATTKLDTLTMGANNVTLYAIYSKTVTVTCNYYNNQNTTVTGTYYNKATSVVVKLPTIAAATKGSDTYNPRGWVSHNGSADATLAAASAGNVTISNNAEYDATYQKTITATFNYYNGEAKTVTANATRYMDYKGALVETEFTVPTAAKASTGPANVPTYSHIATSKNGEAVTPNTANTTYYTVYSKEVTATKYVYNNSASTVKGTAYGYYDGTTANASINLGTTGNATKDSVTYTPRHWSTSDVADAAKTVSLGESVSIISDTTYYASYSKSIEATFNYYNAGAKTATASATRYMNYNGTIKNTDFTVPTAAQAATGPTNVSGFSHIATSKTGTAVTPSTANTTYYTVYKKTVTATKYVYNNVSSTATGTAYGYYDGTTANASINLGTTGNATKDSIEYTPRHWSTSDAADAAKTADLNGSVSIINNTTYYASYSKSIRATFNYYNNGAKTATADATKYMSYKGTTKDSNFTIPDVAKASTGPASVPTYSHIATSKNGASCTPNAGTTTYYTVYAKTVTATKYVYNNVSSTVTGTAYGYYDGTTANASIGLGTTDSVTKDGVTYAPRHWSTSDAANAAKTVDLNGNASIINDTTYYVSYSKTITAIFNYYNNGAKTATADATRYLSYVGTIINSDFTVPSAATASTGPANAPTYSHISKTKNGGSFVPNTEVTTYYTVYAKEVTATLYVYNNTSSTVKGNAYGYYDGTTLNASINLGTTANAIKDEVTYTPRHWSTSDAANAAKTVDLNGNASIINDTTYYASYSKSIEATFNYYNDGAKTAKVSTTRYMSYNGTIINSNFTIPDAAKASTGPADVPTYSHIATSKTGTAVTPNTGTTTYYTVYAKTVTATKYVYDNTSSTATGTAYGYYDGTTANASINLGTTGNATKDSVIYTPRHWSTTSTPNAAKTVALNGDASIITDTTYYASYAKIITATFNYYNDGAKTVTANATRYMSFDGTIKNSNFTVPNEAKASTGPANVPTYSHIATSKTGPAVTPSTANTTYYTVYKKTVTATKYVYNNITTTAGTGTAYGYYDGTTANASINLGTIPTVSGYTARGWSTSDAADATVLTNNTVSIIADTTYYASYQATVTATFNYFDTQAKTETASATKYMSYNGTVKHTDLTVPDAAKASTGPANVPNYSHIATSKNGSAVTPSTANTTYYTVYKKTVTATKYVYNNTTTTAGTGTAYGYYDGTTANASINLGTVPAVDGYTARGWSTSDAANATVLTNNTVSIINNTSYYASYSYQVTLTYNANGGTGTAPTAQNATACMNYKGTKANATFTVATGELTKTDATQVAWNSGTTGAGTTYGYGSSVGFNANTTIYAMWMKATDPSNVAVKKGVAATFTVTGTNASTYQWYKASASSNASTTSAGNGTIITGATSNSYTIPAASVVSGLNNTYYYCVVKNSNNSTAIYKTKAAKLTVYYEQSVKALTNVEIKENENASFDATASGGNPSSGYTYKWYWTTANSNSNGTEITASTAGATISGQTSAVLSLNNVNRSWNNYYVYCETSNGQYTVKSNVAKITVYYPPVVSVSNAVAPAGSTATFTAEITTAGNPSTYTYQWYKEDGTAISGATNSTYSFQATSALDGSGYYCVVNNGKYTVQSGVGYLTSAGITGGSVKYIVPGGQVTLTPTRSGSVGTINWTIVGSTSNITLSAQTGNSITVTAKTGSVEGTYQVKATDSVTGSNTTYTIEVISMSISPTSCTLTLPNAKTQGIVVTKNGNVGTVSYESSNTAVATVSSDGTITGVSKGTCIITVKEANANITKTCSVTVNRSGITVPSSPAAKTFNTQEQSCGITTPTGTSVVTGSTTAATNAGTYSVTYKLNDTTNYEWNDGSITNKSVNWTINKYNLSNATIATIANQTYTGSAITPTPAVTVPIPSSTNKTTLTNNTHFTYGYSSNTNVGTATVTVTAKDNTNYTGSKTANFTIGKKSITIPSSPAAKTFNAQEQGSGITTPTGASIVTASSTVKATNAGIYNVVYQLTDATNTQWSDGTTTNKTVSWTINKYNLSNATIGTISNQTYTGSVITPTPAVTVPISSTGSGTTTLTNNTHFTFSYTNNINVGSATITITAKDNTNYTGSKESTFTIVKKSITVPTSPAAKTYNTQEQQSGITTPTGASIVAANSTTAATNAGTYSVEYQLDDPTNTQWAGGTVTNKTVNWVINKYNLSNATIATTANKTYTGSEIKPTPAVTVPIPSSTNKTTLTNNTHFTYSYSDNTNVGTATITVTAKANTNYTGSKTANFTIVKKSITIPSSPAVKAYTGSSQNSGISTPGGASVVTASSTTSATEAGTYNVVYQLSDTTNTQWSDGTITNKTVQWKISRINDVNTMYVNASETGKEVTITGTNMGTLSILTAPDATKAIATIDNTTKKLKVVGKPGATGTTKVVVKEAAGGATTEVNIVLDTVLPEWDISVKNVY